MTISAKIIRDSINEYGKRLLTYELTYPRFIHSEFMTHRVLSKNAASSRAIPTLKQLKRILSNMAMPIHWGANRPGMQATDELTGWRLPAAKALWKVAGYTAVGFARIGDKIGMHKQTINRIVEPWSHITVVVSGTEWDNFFALRAHPAAQPEIQELARVMLIAAAQSEPKLLQPGEWHLPYFDELDEAKIDDAFLIKTPDGIIQGGLEEIEYDGKKYDKHTCRLLVSAAKCARTSYLNHDGKRTTLAEDLSIATRLLGAVPPHLSPFEHQATPDQYVDDSGDSVGYWLNEHQWANFREWRQSRHILAGQ